ncbi:hypothetical protein KHA94_10725 [Bacillus sp. FJAT-49705]|uniref:SCP2 domain-containing protein n=1 Tax=Cytobacillus citreus TaxID=2833586 RepID=A0ABS5NS87_9BACI|nr:hypothetical protein [Cytobacillus citreus]MBS4190657.1 hypothetical protein [Cytobacillus citreus]
MVELATAFIEEVKLNGHINQLLRGTAFSICLKSENEEIPLLFRDGEITVHFPDPDQIYDAIITGPKERIYSILTGQEKLRDVISRSGITVEATFRKILFLESLFFLCKVC